MAFGLRGRWAAGVAGEKPAGHERPSPRARRRSWGFAALLAALVLSLYLPAVRFGLIWDDPLWFQQGAGRSAWEIITALSTYQFYRPLAILLNRSLVSPAGLVNVTAAHLIQLAAHLSAALLAVPVLRALGLGARHARLAALVFALFPLSYQAVAWQSPQQPLTQAGVLAALACAARAHAARPALWLTLSAVCYGAALLFQESALPFAFAFVWLAVVQRGAARRPAWWWPGLHLALAGLYGLLWLGLPRLGGVTGAGFQLSVLGYGLQALVFPLAAVAMRWLPNLAAWSLPALVAFYAAAAALLAAAVARWTGRRAAAVCLAWAAAGLLPIWAGLSWDYVQIGERLLYPAALGIAGLWAAPMLWLVTPAAPAWRRALGGLALVGVLGVSVWQVQQWQRLYTAGTAHLAAATRVLSAAPNGRLLFVNFPDRLALAPPPYALGYWGLTLAPVVQDLADYARAASGDSAADQSLAVFAVGTAERAGWRYRVDLRGSDTPPSGVWAAARWADEVYLTDYRPDGTLALRPVGAVQPAVAEAAPLATLPNAALLEAGWETAPGEAPQLVLRWQAPEALPLDTTIFVHYWQAGDFVSAADGDSLGGLLPPAAWQPDGVVIDRRPAPALPPGQYEVAVGLYQRWSGQRLPALAPDGRPFADDAVFVTTLTVP